MTAAQSNAIPRNRAALHILMPTIAPAAIVGLYFTPVTLIGCANRGLLAVAVALISAVAAFVTVAIAIRCGARGDSSSTWWILSTVILMLPIALLLGPLG